jgi:hypothetical protein
MHDDTSPVGEYVNTVEKNTEDLLVSKESALEVKAEKKKSITKLHYLKRWCRLEEKY